MRKLLLLSALCMMSALLFASAATAQDGGCPPGTTSVEGGCLLEDGTIQTPDQLFACEGIVDQAEYEACAAEQAAAGNPNFADPAVAPPEPTVSCDQFIALGTGEPSQFQAQQFYDFVATPEERAILDPDGNGFACDDGTIEFGADPAAAPVPGEVPGEVAASTGYAALPDTGGPSLLLPVGLVLAGTGLTSLALRRRAS